MRSGRRLDIGIGLVLLLLPLLWFAPQALGHQTLLPADNLFTSLPWSAFASEMGATVPQNPLISDLVLENYPWKIFLKEALSSGQLPLWNSRLFAGVPFLAAGQHSALYPLSVVFYLLPLWRAYGIFTWLQLGLAALGAYILARVLGLRRPPAVLAAVVFAFSGFYIVSVNFTMVIAAAAWLPYLLAVVELMARAVENEAGGTGKPASEAGTAQGIDSLPLSDSGAHAGARLVTRMPALAVAGAVLLGIQILAGHIEITYYVLLVSSFYALWRVAGVARHLARRQVLPWRPVGRLIGWLLVAAGLGLALGAVQLAPLYELVRESFREGSASLAQVRGWAWPKQQIITFVLPDFFGNPTHHSYFDIWTRSWQPVTQNALGKPLHTIEWGIKNYVEGANYLGVLALLLAALAGVSGAYRLVVAAARARRERSALDVPPAVSRVLFFAILAVLSLLFAFGTPLYGVLYYLLPGYKQLHSAFRWVFPYTLSMALLAGYGLDWLAQSRENPGLQPFIRRCGRLLGALAAAAGVAALLLVALSLIVPGPFVALGQRILSASEQARSNAFANAAMAWSYEASGIARFGLMAFLAGALVLWGVGKRYASLAAVALVILDLWLFGHAFNPAVDPKLLDFEPPVVTWLQNQQDTGQPWRLTSYERPGEKIFNPNVGMPYGLEDIRGYDSIIPRPYVAYMERHQPQTDLLYNRIAPTYSEVNGQPAEKSLDDPLLNLLGVRYVLSTQPIQSPAYRLAYDGELKVYENTRALPRVFIAPQAEAVADQGQALDRLRAIDLRQTVLVEGVQAGDLPTPGSARVAEARISRSGMKESFVDVNLSDRGWLVLSENFFPGWKAYVRPFGAQGEGMAASGEAVEREVPIYRADGAFRAIYLDRAGQWTIRFVYSPRSLLLGGYAAFLALVTLCLILASWAWRRYYRDTRSDVGTVAKNSAVQMVMSLVNKGIDFAFAMLRLRILSPAGEGSFTLAINFYVIFEIVTRFGLGTLLTRDVAQDRTQARRYLANVLVLRTLLWLAGLPFVVLVAYYYHLRGRLTPEEAQAIAVFIGAVFFANIADAITSVFNAFEKMEYPATLATATAIGKVALGGLVLLPPLNLGFVGLAWVSLVMNVVQVGWLYVVLRRQVLPAPPAHRPRMAVEPGLQRQMLGESGPLMINNLLATVYWRLSVWVLYDVAGAVAVGIFSAGMKYVDGLNVIPAYFTLAIFPLMSRYARAGTEGVVKAYRLAVQLLFIVALPIAVFVTFAATPLIRILGGAAYLPDSATALSIMIWSIPIGFMNSVTQYALIAVGQQRFLTRAFVIGVVCTGILNVLLVPRFGYLAAAAIMIPSELALFVPFYWAVRRHVAPIAWIRLLAVPIAGTVLDAATVAGLTRAGAPLAAAIAAGLLVYLGVLGALGTFRSPDFAVLWSRFEHNRILGSLRLPRTE